MQGYCAALPLVADLHLETEDVTELTLQRVEVRVDRLRRISGAGAADVGAWARSGSLSARPALGLTD